MAENWEELSNILQSRELTSEELKERHVSIQQRFSRFRDMVVLIFTRSRKVQQLSEERRRQIGEAIHSCSTTEGILEIALVSLRQSTLFDDHARSMIANDIFDGRYDLLLLPDRFDCDELPRYRASAANTPLGEHNEMHLYELITYELGCKHNLAFVGLTTFC